MKILRTNLEQVLNIRSDGRLSHETPPSSSAGRNNISREPLDGGAAFGGRSNGIDFYNRSGRIGNSLARSLHGGKGKDVDFDA